MTHPPLQGHIGKNPNKGGIKIMIEMVPISVELIIQKSYADWELALAIWNKWIEGNRRPRALRSTRHEASTPLRRRKQTDALQKTATAPKDRSVAELSRSKCLSPADTGNSGRSLGQLIFALTVAWVLAGCSSFARVTEARPTYRTVSIGSGALAQGNSEIISAQKVHGERPLVALAKYAAALEATSPYDPNKLVILVINRLGDSPSTWAPMLNALRGNAAVRRRYQFWFYSYPSGYPYPIAAMLLRRELDALKKKFPLRHKMIAIGHGMGGNIARLLITDTHDGNLWRKHFKAPPNQVAMSAENKKLFVEALIFKSRSEIGGVIFMASPLRGSELAVRPLARLVSGLIKAPSTLLRAGSGLGNAMTYPAGERELNRIPDSIDTLAPSNRFVLSINTIPITPGVPHFTIVGDRGRGDAPNSSDGVVPYWSSHMDGAVSETIVPSGHNVHQNAKAIAEVERILLRKTTPGSRRSKVESRRPKVPFRGDAAGQNPSPEFRGQKPDAGN